MGKAEEGNGTMANQPSVSVRGNRIHADTSLIFDREVVTLDPWTRDPANSRNGDRFWCWNSEDHGGIGRNLTGWNNRANARVETGEETERRRRRVRRRMTEQDLRRLAAQQGILEFTNRLSHSRASSHPGEEALGGRVGAAMNHREEERVHGAQGGGGGRRTEALGYNRCQGTLRPSEPHLKKGRAHSHTSDTGQDRRRRRRESRNVTFNLEGLRLSERRSSRSEDERTSRDEERGAKHRSRARLRRLKVNVRLIPRGKSKVHPKRRQERGRSGGSGTETSKGQDAGEKGQTKERRPKRKTSARVEGLAEDGEERKEGKGGETAQKSQTASTVGPGAAERRAAEDHPQMIDDTGPVDQLPPDPQHRQGGCAPPHPPASVDGSTSPQGGSFSHSTTSTGAGSVFAGWIASSASSVAPGSSNGPSASVLLANILQSPPGFTSPLLATQSKDFFSPAALERSLPPPSASSPCVEKLGPDPAPEPGPQPDMLLEPCRVPAVRQGVETENGGGAERAEVLPLRGLGGSTQTGEGPLLGEKSNTTSTQADPDGNAAKVLQQEYLSEDGGSDLKRKLRLVLPEKTSSRPLTALERKIR